MGLVERAQALLNRLLPRASFVRSVGVLAGGTAVAQAIGVLALPFITRLYSPEDFSVLAVFSSIVAIMTVAACLRLEIAIPLPEKDEDAVNLLILSLFFCTFISLAVSLVILFFSADLAALLSRPKIEPYLWYVPLGIWLTSSYSAVQLWATRNKQFLAIAKTRMTQTLGSVGLQISLGLLSGIGALGLIIGQLIYCGAGTFGLLRPQLQNIRKLTKTVDCQKLKAVFKEYRNYPKYSTFEGLANSAATDVPILIIGASIAGPEVGFLFLAMKIMIIPLGLIGRAVSNVYLSHAAEKHRSGELKIFTINVIDGLFKTGVGPLLFIGILAPAVAAPIFGDEWQRAGEVVAMLTPWFILNYISSPISMALHVAKRHRKALALHIFGLIIRVGLVVIGVEYFPRHVLEIYAFSSALFYLSFFCSIAAAVGIEWRDVFLLMRHNFSSIFIWAVGGGLLAFAIRMIRDLITVG